MKNILTLQTSSMFFVGAVNLHKGIPTEIDSVEMTDKEITMVNSFISNGSIVASNGLFSKKEVEIAEDPITTKEVEVSSPTVVEVPTKVETPVKKPTVRKAPVKKPVAKKED